jgi:hypothetical protein
LRGRPTVALRVEPIELPAPWNQELETLRRQVPGAPHPTEEVILALWGRRGVGPEVIRAGAMGLGAEDIVSG